MPQSQETSLRSGGYFHNTEEDLTESSCEHHPNEKTNTARSTPPTIHLIIDPARSVHFHVLDLCMM